MNAMEEVIRNELKQFVQRDSATIRSYVRGNMLVIQRFSLRWNSSLKDGLDD